MTWTVVNDGIGRTDRAQWTDVVPLATNPDGTGVVRSTVFDHIGVLGAGGRTAAACRSTCQTASRAPTTCASARRTVRVHLHQQQHAVSGPVAVTLSPSPDLKVTNIVVPLEADEGDASTCRGPCSTTARRRPRQMDRHARPAQVRRPDGAADRLGSYAYSGELGAGISYTRTERFMLPRLEGAWQLVVATNVGGALYEFGAGSGNNSRRRRGDHAVAAPAARPAGAEHRRARSVEAGGRSR